MDDTAVETRRERLRRSTTAEIKEIALRLLVEGGPSALTLRAVARQIGMAPNALYGYFASRDDLVAALRDDQYAALARAARDSRDIAAAEGVDGQLRAWAHAVREWALENPTGWHLIFDDPTGGHRSAPCPPPPEGDFDMCMPLLEFAEATLPHSRLTAASTAYQWSDFDDALTERVQAALPDLPPEGIALGLRIWARLHGLVAFELDGRIRAPSTVAATIYDDEITHLLRSAGTGEMDSPRNRSAER
ncbi:TetR/AcrR family transcriptional regulator [Sciscionella sediminilitoris]|uniref:TetR/AcrR family transcriptional regulator n=1 Tax=Sciscionella sediminilitoris TaxID=1445613 RepID=UPI00068B876A|nr:TetR/AcrR family transcriptional regulator [Sciscionella sp. SE31]